MRATEDKPTWYLLVKMAKEIIFVFVLCIDKNFFFIPFLLKQKLYANNLLRFR